MHLEVIANKKVEKVQWSFQNILPKRNSVFKLSWDWLLVPIRENLWGLNNCNKAWVRQHSPSRNRKTYIQFRLHGTMTLDKIWRMKEQWWQKSKEQPSTVKTFWKLCYLLLFITCQEKAQPKPVWFTNKAWSTGKFHAFILPSHLSFYKNKNNNDHLN